MLKAVLFMRQPKLFVLETTHVYGSWRSRIREMRVLLQACQKVGFTLTNVSFDYRDSI